MINTLSGTSISVLKQFQLGKKWRFLEKKKKYIHCTCNALEFIDQFYTHFIFKYKTKNKASTRCASLYEKLQ